MIKKGRKCIKLLNSEKVDSILDVCYRIFMPLSKEKARARKMNGMLRMCGCMLWLAGLVISRPQGEADFKIPNIYEGFPFPP